MAIILRFWHLGQADLSHDELSALIRTHYMSFSELIDQGVKVDGHPALVQVFLYYWAPLVAYNTFWIKLPSVLLGIFSIILVYSASLKVTQNPWNLLGPILMAMGELFLYHHQVARPYAFGAFFVSLAAYAYVGYFHTGNNRKYLWIFGLAATLAAYTHYLALLSVLIIGISALIRDRKNIKVWLITGGLVLLGFSPHLGIFFHQLSLGGVGQWLGPPQWDWLFDFFHASLNFYGSSKYWLLPLILIWLIQNLRSPFPEGVYWFLACFGIAFLYSVFRNPVLQFSSLIFLFPWVFIATYKKRSSLNITLLGFVVLFLIDSMLLDRDSLRRSQISPAMQAGRIKSNLLETEGLEIPVYYHWSTEKWDFYRSIDSQVPEGRPLDSLDEELLSHDSFLVIMDHLSPRHWPLQLMDLGYDISYQENNFGFTLYVFRKGARDRSISRIKELPRDTFKLAAQGYTPIIPDLRGPDFLVNNKQTQIVINLKADSLNPNTHLVFQISQKGEQVAWISHPLKNGNSIVSQPVGAYPFEDYQWRLIIDQGNKPTTANLNLHIRYWEANPEIYGLVQNY